VIEMNNRNTREEGEDEGARKVDFKTLVRRGIQMSIRRIP